VLAQAYGSLRDRVGILNYYVSEAHNEVQMCDLAEHTPSKAKRSVPSLFQELSINRGKTWRDIARVADVSATAVR